MLEIEIVYGLADRQVLKNMTVTEGTTVREAALQSGLEVEFPELDLQQAPLGIFWQGGERQDGVARWRSD